MCGNNQFIRATIFMIVCCIAPSCSWAVLDNQDQLSLSQSLSVLSQKWSQSAASKAFKIFRSPRYDRSDFQDFFANYFLNQPFTEKLRTYFDYLGFVWSLPNVQKKVNPALAVAIQQNLISLCNTAEAYTQLSSEKQLSLLNQARFLNLYSKSASKQQKKVLYEFYLHWLKNMRDAHVEQSFYWVMQAQLLINALDLFALNVELRMELADAAGLLGEYRRLWLQHGVVLLERHELSNQQKRWITSYLENLPIGLHNLRYIALAAVLEGEKGIQFELTTAGQGVVIDHQNSDSILPGMADLDPFYLALAKSVSRVIDQYSIQSNFQLKKRKQVLLTAAGLDAQHYLASPTERGYFVDNPNEFFAMMGLYWSFDSNKSLQSAVTTWRKGNRHPLQHVLFLTDVYSKGKNALPFFYFDAKRGLETQKVTIKRDSEGNIIELVVGNDLYAFYWKSGSIYRVEQVKLLDKTLSI
ncbi:hypothetical protein [Zooshikella harenae]|uniref:Uncharacterized protein n=1 Tax=Zooshikella harenae TaxID=2827238 RepID=A0ABS5ZDT0_9GAMM|nr:hypothetical protein [Zooshikella harenae]MBU2711988.1 hypothetical protein [Zooshikella harenae]